MININDVKVFFISLIQNEERIANVNNVIEKLQLSNYKTLYTNYLYFLNNEFTNILKKHLIIDSSKKDSYVINSFDLFINHYKIISEAYWLKYDNIIICEDDIAIINYSYFKDLINNIPDSADFIQFGYDEKIFKSTIDHNILIKENNLYNKVINIETYSTMCCFYSKKMIEFLYNYYKTHISYADNYQYDDSLKNQNFNIYTPIKPVLNLLKYNTTI